MKRLLFIIPIILSLHSCHKQATTSTSLGESEVDMTFSTQATTRSEGSAAERAIKQVDILVFDREGVDADNATFLYQRYAWNKQGDTYRTMLLIGAHLDIYVAVNVRELVNSEEIVEGMKWSEVREKLTLTNPDQIDLENQALPMWGYVHDYTVKDQPLNHLGTLKLLRAVSSADISITATNFSLDKGHIVFGANKGYLPFSPSNVNLDFTVKTPEVPSDMVATTEWTYAVLPTHKQIINRFYMYDNDAPVGDKRYTKVVLEGKWSGSSLTQNTFYPLAFRNPTTNAQLKVTRNKKYVIVVTNVNGDGFADLESAKRGDDVNMDYQVIPWDDNSDGDIMIDGTKFFAMPSKKVTLFRDLGSVTEIVFQTNYPLGEIKISFDQAVEGVAGQLDTHPRFKAEVLWATNADGPYTCFRFTAKQPYGVSNNPATLFVSAGRISFNIIVNQINSNPNDWGDGGEDKHELE